MEKMGRKASFIVLVLLAMAAQSRADCTFQDGRKIVCEDLTSLPSSYPADNATHLEFTMGNIKNITANAFAGMKNLKMIHLFKSQVENIDPEAFQGLDELETLNLGENGITEILPGTFSILPKLKTLRLENNKLSSLPENSLPSSLQSLELDYNMFTEVPFHAITNIEGLNTLKMNNNKLTSLPDLSAIKTLKNLEVTDNQMTGVDPKIFDGLNLKELLMNSNPFTCDCNLTAFFQWIKAYEFEPDTFSPEFSEYECDGSNSLGLLRGKTFDMFNITAFQTLNCSISSPKVVFVSGKGVATSLISSTFISVMLVVASVLWKIEE